MLRLPFDDFLQDASLGHTFVQTDDKQIQCRYRDLTESICLKYILKQAQTRKVNNGQFFYANFSMEIHQFEKVEAFESVLS